LGGDEGGDVGVEVILVALKGGGYGVDGGEGGGVREEGVQVVDGVVVN
jgi:hypothetical protein